jgi:type II secretory pathway component PulM
MKVLPSLVAQSWRNVSVRDRTLLMGVVLVGAFVLLYAWVYAPAERARTQRLQNLPALASEAAQVQALGSEIAALRSAPANVAVPPLPARLNGSLRERLPTGAQLLMRGTDRVAVQIDGASVGALLRWLEQATRAERLRVASANLERLPEGRVRGEIVLVQP